MNELDVARAALAKVIKERDAMKDAMVDCDTKDLRTPDSVPDSLRRLAEEVNCGFKASDPDLWAEWLRRQADVIDAALKEQP